MIYPLGDYIDIQQDTGPSAGARGGSSAGASPTRGTWQTHRVDVYLMWSCCVLKANEIEAGGPCKHMWGCYSLFTAPNTGRRCNDRGARWGFPIIGVYPFLPPPPQNRPYIPKLGGTLLGVLLIREFYYLGGGGGGGYSKGRFFS